MSKPAGPPTAVGSFPALLKIMIVTALSTVFSPDPRSALHKSALFMVIFLVVHMLGNLTAFAGREAFNAYGHKLRSNPLILFIEYYLLAAAAVHGVVALYLSWGKRKFISKKPWQNGKLLLTSILVTAFAVVHVRSFRFGPTHSSATGKPFVHALPADGMAQDMLGIGGQEVVDLYSMCLEVFASPLQIVFYLASVAAVGVHLSVGWTKTVNRMVGLADQKPETKAQKQAIDVLGRALVWPLCGGFMLTTGFFAYLARQ